MNLNNAEFFDSYGTGNQLPISDRPEICFCGRSNVGKSSLINKLLNRKAIARVSSTPGKTTTINFFKADNIFLVDLPGYGYAKVERKERERWDSLMDAYFSGNRDIRVCFQLLDVRRDLSCDDERMIGFMRSRSVPFAAVLTKCDKLNKAELAERINYWQTLLENTPVFPFSALKGTGKAEILDFIGRNAE